MGGGGGGKLLLSLFSQASGVQNTYFPLLVSKHALEREKSHIEGFSEEVRGVLDFCFILPIVNSNFYSFLLFSYLILIGSSNAV